MAKKISSSGSPDRRTAADRGRAQLNVEVDSVLLKRCRVIAEVEGISMQAMVERQLNRYATSKRYENALSRLEEIA